MANQRARKTQRRQELSDKHVVIGDSNHSQSLPSPHLDRLEHMRYLDVGHDPEVLATNLRLLLQQKGMTRRKVWTAIGEQSRAWFERVVKRGLSNVTPKGRDRLEKVASFFGLSYDDLWRPDLITFEVGQPRQEFQGYSEKLTDLLLSGKHEYLKDLIDSLHRNLWKNVKLEQEPDPDPTESIPPPRERFGWKNR